MTVLLRISLAALALAAACGVAHAEDVPDLRRLFPHEAALEAPRGGLVRLVLPPDVLKACRPDLSDLRVFDSRDRELAYLVDSGGGEAVEVLESFEASVLGLTRDEATPEHAPPTHRETYEIDVPPGPPSAGRWELVIEVSRKRFVRVVDVARLAPEGDIELAKAEPVFRLDANTERTRIALPELEGGPLRVSIRGEEGFYLEPRFRFESSRQFDRSDRGVVALEEIAREQRDGMTVVELERPVGLVPDLIEVETATDSFHRDVTVWDERPGSAPRRLGNATVYRVGGPDAIEHRKLSLRQAGGHTLRVVIQDGDSPSLEELRFRAVIRRPVLLFALPGSADTFATGRIRFGGGRARAPRYDLSELLVGARRSLEGRPAEAAARLYDPAALAVAQLTEVRPNAFFDSRPALHFAMHPGAEIDVRIFSHQRELLLEPSDDGLSRVRLAPADAAHSMAELGDLRIVDTQSRQWPYLLKRSARSEPVPLAIEGPESRRKVSVYRFDSPVTPVHVDRLTLDATAPFFDRAVRLYAIDENGDRRALTSVRLVKRARDPRPVRLSFSSPPLYGFELEVEDGDDAPLQLTRAVTRVRLPEVFLAAPGGTYRMLIGNLDVTTPRYELERVRDLVLAVKSRTALPGELEPNPTYSLAARLGAGDGVAGIVKQAVVWVVLLGAVAILGLLTLRVARREPEIEG